MHKIQLLPIALLALSLTLPTLDDARADLPPPDGYKRVSYAFKVGGLDRFPDHVVVAFPWSTSNGAPTTEHTLVANDDLVFVGRRSPTVSLHAVRKAAWEAFAAEKLGPDPSKESEYAAALAEFLVAPNAVRCDVRLSPVSEVPTSDERDQVVEAFTATKIDDTTCAIAAVKAPAPAAKPAGKSACAGGDASWPALLGLMFVVWALPRRRAGGRAA